MSLSVYDIIFNIEKTKESTIKLPKIINKLARSQYTTKSQLHLYTLRAKKSGKWNYRNNSIYIGIKNYKIFGNIFSKDIKDIHTENCNTMMKVNKWDLNN